MTLKLGAAGKGKGTEQTNMNSKKVKMNKNSIIAEVERAEGVEVSLTAAVDAEVTRATGVEGVLTETVVAEVARAASVKEELTTAIGVEVARALLAEVVLTTAVNNKVSKDGEEKIDGLKHFNGGIVGDVTGTVLTASQDKITYYGWFNIIWFYWI